MTTGALLDDNLYSYDYNVSDIPDYDLPQLCENTWSEKLAIKVVQLSIFSVVLLLGLLGNSLVIATFTLYRHERLRCMTDVFLLHLAFCDLLLLLTLPLQAGDTLLGRWDFGTALCKLTRGLYAVNTYAGLMLLACISVERYMVIVSVRSAQQLRRRRMLCSSVAASAVWLASLILSLPEIMFVQVQTTNEQLQCEMNGWEKGSWWAKMVARWSQVAGFCIPFFVMVVCYSLIGRTLMQGEGWRRQRTLRLILLLVLVFLLFQMPYTVVLSLKMARNLDRCQQWGTLILAEYATCSLAYTRCCLNPLLYALVGIRFRNDVIKLLRNLGCVCEHHLILHSNSSVSVYHISTSHH